MHCRPKGGRLDTKLRFGPNLYCVMEGEQKQPASCLLLIFYKYFSRPTASRLNNTSVQLRCPGLRFLRRVILTLHKRLQLLKMLDLRQMSRSHGFWEASLAVTSTTLLFAGFAMLLRVLTIIAKAREAKRNKTSPDDRIVLWNDKVLILSSVSV